MSTSHKQTVNGNISGQTIATNVPNNIPTLNTGQNVAPNITGNPVPNLAGTSSTSSGIASYQAYSAQYGGPTNPTIPQIPPQKTSYVNVPNQKTSVPFSHLQKNQQLPQNMNTAVNMPAPYPPYPYPQMVPYYVPNNVPPQPETDKCPTCNKANYHNKNSYLLFSSPIEITSDVYEPIAFFPWLETDDLVSGKVIFDTMIDSGAIDVQLYDSTHDNVLGKYNNIAKTGIYSFKFTFPNKSSRLQIQVRKNEAETAVAKIFSAMVKLV